MQEKFFILQFFYLCFLPGIVLSQNLPDNDSVYITGATAPLFSSNEILDISIYFDDLKALKKDLSDNPSTHKAQLLIHNPDSENIFNIKVSTRGIFRKDPSHCNFPPLKLDFRKQELDNTIFEDQNRLKLVTHCRSGNLEYDQFVIQEYLAYRIYNILTEKSFRVRLARVTYIDNRHKIKDLTRYAFLIEDVDDMAKRNCCTHVDLNNIPQNYTDYFFENLVSVFQYMIGNTDWSVPGMHNIKLIMEKPDHRPVPVPYDFDFSGIVNPPYAVPNAKFGIESVDVRLFRGYERPIEDLQRVFDYILTKQDEIMRLYENSPLSLEQKKRAMDYLDEFFMIISDEELIKKEFVSVGRKYN
ncbi:MAG: hypothetical protein K9H12_09305 [Bacteroidales bacterium]|nr:hypothetical protein [Bacteroidales bacterium]